MKLTVLGNNGPYPSAGGACSGYLLEEDNNKLLLDCGNGVLSNLLRVTGFLELDAIILSHLHSDHISDMFILKYAIEIMNKKGMLKKPITVYAPDEPAEELERINVNGVFDIKIVNEGLKIKIGKLDISFMEMKHPVKCHAASFYNGDKRFVFSGDTSWTEKIIEFSKGADLVLLDSGLLSKDKTNDNVPHLTAKECGLVAKTAGVKKLMLTHFFPEYDKSELLKEAKAEFENTYLAGLLESYEI